MLNFNPRGMSDCSLDLEDHEETIFWEIESLSRGTTLFDSDVKPQRVADQAIKSGRTGGPTQTAFQPEYIAGLCASS